MELPYYTFLSYKNNETLKSQKMKKSKLKADPVAHSLLA